MKNTVKAVVLIVCAVTLYHPKTDAYTLKEMQEFCQQAYQARGMAGPGYILNILRGGVAASKTPQIREQNLQLLGWMQQNCKDAL